jgi:hypothetical protein
VDSWRNYNAHNRETTLATDYRALVCNATTGICTGNRESLDEKSTTL